MSWWKRVLDAVGVRVLTGTSAPTFDADLAAEGRYVFVLNDAVSPMADVIPWLEASFGLSKADAARTMAVVHNHGFGVLGPLEPGVASDRVSRARREATKRGLDALRFSTDVPPPEVLAGELGAIQQA